MSENKTVKVTNRSTGLVVYSAPERRIPMREFNPGETKIIPVEEIAEICAQPGGRELFYHYLQIDDVDTLQETLNVKEEPEYWLTEKQIPTFLNSSTIDEFTDALNYAPDGVKDLIKKYAVSVPLNDVQKRGLIKEILGFDVDGAIESLRPDTPEEKAAMEAAAKAPATRKTAPNYKITSVKSST